MTRDIEATEHASSATRRETLFFVRYPILWALLMGCITTIAIAWGLTLWRPVPNPSQEPISSFYFECRAFGSLRRLSRPLPDHLWFCTDPPLQSWTILEQQAEYVNAVRIEEARGWPFFALRTTWRMDAPPVIRTWGEPNFAGLDCSSVLRLRPRLMRLDDFGIHQGPRALPMTPIADGFLANTLFYSLVWIVLAHFGRPFVLTRQRRRYRTNHCVQCGYDLKGTVSTQCSECGSVLGEIQRRWKPISPWTRPVLLGAALGVVIVQLCFLAVQWSKPWTLHEAAMLGKVDAAITAIQRGADVNATLDSRTSGVTPLVFASCLESPEITQMLLDNGASRTGESARDALSNAAAEEHFAMTSAILKAGVHPEIVYWNPKLPVFNEILNRGASVELVQLFVEYGAQVNPGNNSSWESPLYTAMFGDHPMKETADYLLAQGADVNSRGLGGETVLHQAVYFGKTATVKELLAAGADPNLCNLWGATPLMAAASKGSVEHVQSLLDHGASIDAQHFECPAALFWAVRKANTSDRTGAYKDVVQLLLDRGASLDIVNLQGESVFDISAVESITELLNATMVQREANQ